MARARQIHREIDNSTSECDREKPHERLAKLSGGVAVMRAGAPTEAEMKSRKEALDSAVNATRTAVAEKELRCDGDERTGVQILKRAGNTGAPDSGELGYR